MVQIQSIGSELEDTRISSRNQTVIPAKIRRRLKLKAGDKLFWRLIRVGKEHKILAEKEPKSWADYSLGLGKHIWKSVDIKKYIEDLRNEWD
ncbi:hypothetical protein HY338_02540 [Candidatus Gottesmanbacteria bacterium]|nr:hypothetical protein [Candidatus Gottesmanbacteria bacterium]